MTRKKPRVLVVDDYDDQREILSQLLQYSGYAVATAADGLSALERAVIFRPSVILLDMALPHLDGYEVARHLKADRRTAAVPIIAVTGHASPEAEANALRAGCASVLVKPVEFSDLLADVRRVLETVPRPGRSRRARHQP